MKKCFSALVILIWILALFVSPTLAAKGTIGYVVPYKVGYFSSFVNSFESVAKAEGYKTIQLHHEYNAAKENKAIDLWHDAGLPKKSVQQPLGPA